MRLEVEDSGTNGPDFQRFAEGNRPGCNLSRDNDNAKEPTYMAYPFDLPA